MSMLSPGGVGHSRSYSSPRRRRRRRLVPVLASLTVLALIATAAWYFLIYRSEPATTPSASSCPTGQPTPAVPKPPFEPAKVTVNVYNATGRKGLAASTAAALRRRGFVIANIANDPLGRKVAGPAEIRSGPKGRSRTPVLALQVAGARSTVDRRASMTVDLVLGEKFTALRTPAQINALLTPPPRPPGC